MDLIWVFISDLIQSIIFVLLNTAARGHQGHLLQQGEIWIGLITHRIPAPLLLTGSHWDQWV